jgi:hypothetical protein
MSVRRLTKNVCALAVGLALAGGAAACSRKKAPEPEPAAAPAAAPPPAPPPPAPSVRDAAADVVDAASDAGDARRGTGKRWAGAPPAGGGGVGMKIEGSLSRAEGDKVLQAARGKLRACFEAAHPPGSGRSGRVSFKLTINDRGHVTLTEILSSSLPGGSDVEACMVTALRNLLFPRAGGESTLSFAMTFGR